MTTLLPAHPDLLGSTSAERLEEKNNLTGAELLSLYLSNCPESTARWIPASQKLRAR
nr:hypothetical protein [Pseudomonas sp.]